MPVTILNSPAVSDRRIGGDNPKFGTSRDIAGIIVWVMGIVIEVTADQQKVGSTSSLQ
jgi:steroid 5-alpha reductase family enzyme